MIQPTAQPRAAPSRAVIRVRKVTRAIKVGPGHAQGAAASQVTAPDQHVCQHHRGDEEPASTQDQQQQSAPEPAHLRVQVPRRLSQRGAVRWFV